MAAVEQRRKLFQTRQSRLGTQLSETITQRVIMLVLIMLIVVPLLTQTTVDKAPESLTHDLQYFNSKVSEPVLSSVIDWFVGNYNERDGRPFLLKLDVEPIGVLCLFIFLMKTLLTLFVLCSRLPLCY